MRLKQYLRTTILALISGASLVVAFYVVGIDTVLSALTSIQLGPALLAGILVLANAGFALLRFRSVLRVFGYRPQWRQIVFAFTIGQVSNQVLFNIIGQSLSRAAALNSAGVPFSVSVMATYWERLIAAGLLFLLSIVSALFLFLHIRIDLQTGGAYLLSLAGGIALAAAVAVTTVIRSREVDVDLSSALRFLLRLWPSLSLTLLAHGAMLGAYIVVLAGLHAPQIDIYVVASLTIVMLAASLPISFSGWGIRELSAAQALGAVGVEPTTAIAGAVVIGLLGLLITVLGGAVGLHLHLQRKPSSAVQSAQSVTVVPSDRWSEIAILGSVVISAILLFFQIRLPLDQGAITANAADILALTGLGLLGFFLWSTRSIGPVPAWFFWGLGAISLLFLFGLGLSYVRFGSNSWALMNRGLGWIIISGYVALGASTATLASAGALRLVLGIFAVTGVTLAGQQIVLMLLALFGVNFPSDAFAVPLRGYANNSNAFAFQLVMATACLVTASRIGLFALRPVLQHTAFVITSLAIYYSHSRAGLGMLIILLVFTVVFSEPQQRGLAIKTAMIVSASLIAAFFLPDIIQAKSLLQNSSIASYLSVTVERTSSDSERWLSIIEGWDLWLKHPILGAGLGGYVQERLSAGRDFLVIHSIPVWLMAEMGLVGLLVIGIVLAFLVRNAFQLMARPDKQGWGIGLLIILACMAAAGLVHDLFFQRSFWFLLGLFVAAGYRADETRQTAPTG